jgi:hypothetical protein
MYAMYYASILWCWQLVRILPSLLKGVMLQYESLSPSNIKQQWAALGAVPIEVL